MRSTQAYLAALAFGLAAFALLALAYDVEPLATIDREIAHRNADDFPVALERAARPFSWLGGAIGLTFLGAPRR